MSSKRNKTVRIALATRNSGKVDELRLGLRHLGVVVDGVECFPGFPEVDETESTLEGNAKLKSRALFEYSGVPSLADDTGLEVDALEGAPGVQSARYAGNACDPVENRRKLLAELARTADRRARFRTVLAFTDRRGTRFFEGVCEGMITDLERGSGGFGYDPIFRPRGHSETFAEMSPEVKNSISHRGAAIRSFVEFLSSYQHIG